MMYLLTHVSVRDALLSNVAVCSKPAKEGTLVIYLGKFLCVRNYKSFAFAVRLFKKKKKKKRNEMSQCVKLWRMENMYICCLAHLQTSLFVPMLWPPRRHRNKWSSRPLNHCKDNEDWAEDDVLSGEARSIDKFKFQTMILCEKFAMKMPAVGKKWRDWCSLPLSPSCLRCGFCVLKRPRLCESRD